MEPGEVRNRTLTQLRRGVLPHCVLAVLDGEERYGFELVRVMTATDGFEVGEGTIYPLLSRLRREGLVATTWRESDAGPPRRYYRLTAEGRRALTAFRAEWVAFRDAVDHILAGAAPGEAPDPASDPASEPGSDPERGRTEETDR